MPWPKGRPRSDETRAKIGSTVRAAGIRPPSPAGRVATEETRAKIRVANEGRPVPQERRDRIAATLKGQEPSLANRLAHGTPEARARAAARARGRKHSIETREKMSVSHRARVPFPASKSRRKIKAVLREAVLERDGAVCGLCCAAIDLTFKSPHAMSLSFDHILAVANGGDDSLDNLQPAHRICNTLKGWR